MELREEGRVKGKLGEMESREEGRTDMERGGWDYEKSRGGRTL
jgi:hypothetical protein